MNQDEFMYEKKLTSVVPSARQLALEQMEFYGFIHFTVNTFTDREWGDGTESESVLTRLIWMLMSGRRWQKRLE